MVNLAAGLASAGCVVDLVVAKAAGPYLSEVPSSVRLVDLDCGGAAAAFLRLVGYLRSARPIAMVSTLAHANAVAVAACRVGGRGTRVYVREASMFPMDLPPGMKGRVISAILPTLYRRADGVVAVSAGVARHAATVFGLDPRRVRVIYNGVICPALFEMAARPLEHPWFRPGEPPVALAVGNLKKAKDFATLLRAFSLVRRSARARLLILGEGGERGALEALAGDLGLGEDVSLPGFVANPFPYMRAAGVFVLSSVTEGLPNVLIQALALGKPAVATDCQSGPREICAGNPGARLVPVGDAAAMAKSILESLSSPSPAPAPDCLRRFHLAEVSAHYLDFLGIRSTVTNSGMPPDGIPTTPNETIYAR
jgi:glycosyltransferase involved in cell wall biosynthesis